jgi:glucoamylase
MRTSYFRRDDRVAKHPWGETRGDDEIGATIWSDAGSGAATALLATGQRATPLRALIWLACIQKADGDFPQNSWIDGRGYWSGVQLDEIASPILLAWRLQREDLLPTFDPWNMIAKASRYLLLQGPVTGQERWEEQSGFSPSTLAVVIAARLPRNLRACASTRKRRNSS